MDTDRKRDTNDRLASGIRRLDYILKGGFFRGSTYGVVGPPGSGKTIFGNQLCFNHVRQHDGNCVYVTLLVESHAKMFKHLSSLDFFDPTLIPERLYYVSGYQTLCDHGFDGLLELVRKTLRERKATLCIVDGLESADFAAQNDLGLREFINELQSIATLTHCTTFLLSNADHGRQVQSSLVDGSIELSDRLTGPRAVRELTVTKFRGSDYLRGRHEVEILETGLSIHPRTEVQFDKPTGRAFESRSRMRFGIPRLDEMLHGGIPSGSTTALVGAPGTGKTMIGLSFLVEGARQGQHGTYFGFYEPPPRLMEKAAQVGLPLQRYVDAGLINLIWQPPLEHMVDALSEQLLEPFREQQRERRRLFIDGIEGFRAASVYPDRMPRFLSALTNQLRTLDVSTLVAEELELFKPDVSMPNPELASVVESVLLLRYVELNSHLYRLLSIMKMRESSYDTSIREFRIGARGIEVAESFESAEAILSGLPKHRGADKGGDRP
jgi:circadian clock protein KaiC